VARVFVTTLVLELDKSAGPGPAPDSLEAIQLVARGEIARYRGTELEGLSTGRAVVIFDGPARAIRCASAILKAARGIGLPMRAGLHPGECDMTQREVGGPAFDVALRLARAAAAFEVLISRAARDLIAAEGLEIEERAPISQVGVPEVTRRFAVIGGAA
jgi:class 3 adenylate cyclase